MKNEKFCQALLRVIADTIEIEGEVEVLNLFVRACDANDEVDAADRIQEAIDSILVDEYQITPEDMNARDERLVSLVERSIRGEGAEGMPDPDDIPEPTTR